MKRFRRSGFSRGTSRRRSRGSRRGRSYRRGVRPVKTGFRL